ncbi:hypothetical protein [Rhodococcus qingshengii]
MDEEESESEDFVETNEENMIPQGDFLSLLELAMEENREILDRLADQ